MDRGTNEHTFPFCWRPSPRGLFVSSTRIHRSFDQLRGIIFLLFFARPHYISLSPLFHINAYVLRSRAYSCNSHTFHYNTYLTNSVTSFNAINCFSYNHNAYLEHYLCRDDALYLIALTISDFS